jgi:NAD(P)-dependent dehydrogenase (short-subunit alcohol dehydrogenase family)
VIAGDATSVTAPMAGALSADGYRVRVIVPGTGVQALSAQLYAVDLSSPEAVKRAHKLIVGSEGDRVGCLINLLPLAAREAATKGGAAERAFDLSNSLFLLLRQLHEDLASSAEEGGSLVLNVTAIDGQFGLGGCDDSGVAAAGTLGLTKAFHREHPAVRVRTIDVDRASPTLARQLLDEIEMPRGPLETGLTASGRTKIDLVSRPLPRGASPSLPVDESSVVLLTGGAQGITAEVARGLAASKCTLVIAGRSGPPAEEPTETRSLDVAALRLHMIAECQRRGETFTPAAIEHSVGRIVKARALRDNLDSFRRRGARVEYHATDVRDAAKLGALIDDLYARHGRIDGVIHGAGVIHDKRIADKTPEQFADVFRTKVDSALCLASKLRPDALKFLVLFSSVSGRFGNRGQTDYAAANECLNKLARRLSREWAGTRVVAINWGPWDGGMMSDSLRSAYAARGIELIPVEEGVRACLAELSAADGAAEVVISCSVPVLSRMGFEG